MDNKEKGAVMERIVWAAQLLPWWANLILAEVSFVALYLLKSGPALLLAVPGLFLAASVIATIKRDRQINEQNQQRRRQISEEGKAVTKFIVKDLMQEKYRESFLEARKEQEGNSEKYSSMIILGLIVITLMGSTTVMLKMMGSLAPKPETPRVAAVQPRTAPQQPVVRQPVPERRSWSQYGYSSSPPSKPAYHEPERPQSGREQIHAYTTNGITHYTNSLESIEKKIRMRREAAVEKNKKDIFSSYSVIFKSGAKQFCIDAARMKPDVLTIFINEHLRMEIPVQEINYVEAWHEVDGKSRMQVLSVEDF